MGYDSDSDGALLSILIVNWNTRDLLGRCLASIQAHAPATTWEVIVVDNASDDGSADLVEAKYPWARLVRNEFNRGYAAGNNQALEMAKGEFLLTLNPDTEFFDDSLTKAIELFHQQPQVGALGGRLLNRDGTTQQSIRGFPRPLPILFDLLGLAKLFPKVPLLGAYRMTTFDYDKETEVEQPMGTFLMFRKKALEETGHFDERFPIFFNEVDLLWRLRLAGWKILYSPTVKLYHLGGASTRQVRKKMIWESHKSLIRFYYKWYNRLWNLPLLWMFSGVVWLAAWFRARGWSAGFRP